MMLRTIYMLTAGTLLMGCSTSQKLHRIGEEGESEIVTRSSGLQYQIIQEGHGDAVEEGDEVLIFETTMYRNGTILYSNENTDQPIKVKVGANQVLAGIDEGLRGMLKGEVREMMLPSELAKRTVYPDHISPDSALVVKMILFDILK